MRKDKQKVIGEYLGDERLKELLTHQPPAGEDKALHILTRAYRSLRADDFKRFLSFYIETGLTLNPSNRQGHHLLDTLSQHQHSQPYLDALIEQGAR